MSDYFGNTSKGIFDLSDDYQEGIKPHIWCFLVAFAIITICSGSSFLYAFNLWDEANSSFTVGKSIFRGLVPYRDLFDQKGILVYFIYGISSLISATSFRGVFVMEIIAAFFSMLAVLKIYQLFLEPRTFPYILTPITGAIIYSSANFRMGGSAEEFLFPFILWGLYLSVRHFRLSYSKSMDYKTVFIGGLLAGCVFNIKYNALGLFFGWIVMIFLADIIGERNIVKAVISCFIFLGGMIVAIIPWMIYFGIHGAIDDWLYVYIYKNAFEYARQIAFVDRFKGVWGIFIEHCGDNKPVFILVTLGVVYFIASTISTAAYEDRNSLVKRNRLFVEVTVIETINLGVLLCLLFLGIFLGGIDLPHYSFPINGFVLFGFIPFCYIIEKFLKGRIEKNTHGRNYEGGILEASLAFALSLVFFAISVIMSWLLCVNVKSMGISQDELWIYRFKDYIESSDVENPRLIQEFSYDEGLYTVLDIEPMCYYFRMHTQNMQEALDNQVKYLQSGEADFVVTCDVEAEGIEDRYDLVLDTPCRVDNVDHTYYLYQRNGNPAQEQ